MWIGRFIYLNLLWILFTIVGIGVFGLIPATIAMFAVIRQWKTGNDDIPVAKTFWGFYRTDFWRNALFSLLVVGIGYVMLIEMNLFWNQESFFYFVISLLVISTFILYNIILIYFFPVYVHYELSLFQQIKMALIMGIIHPFITIGLLLILTVTYVVVWVAPWLFILLGGSMPANIIMVSALRKFPDSDGETAQQQ